MDPDTLVLEISSDEDAGWNDHGRGVLDGSDDFNWFAELFGEGNKENCGDGSDGVTEVVSESEKDLKKSKSLVELDDDDDDDDDDCVVLDNDPNEPVEVRNDNRSNGDDDSDDVLVVSEKGQVACRDYPHSRHLCIKFPFTTTPNQSHCSQCYCYVCDLLAPCVYWGNGTAITDHCHATDKDEFWILARKNAKIGCKVVQPVTQLSLVDLHTPAPALALALTQPQNQVSNPGLNHAHHTSDNFLYPNIPSQYRNYVLALRNKLDPDLTSQLRLRAQQKYNIGSRVHRPLLKRTGSVRVVTTANQNPYRGNFGNLSRQQNYHLNANGVLSRSSKSLGSLQPSAVKTSVQHHSQSPTDTYSTVNPQLLLQQPQVSNYSNPNFLSHVNPNPFRQPSYTVPAQPSYPVPSKTRLDSHHSSQGNQAQCSILDSGFKDSGSGWAGGQDSATLECTNNSSLPGGLGDHRYDWLFDEQPIEPGFTDYSTDSAFIDTGPIFDFHS